MMALGATHGAAAAAPCVRRCRAEFPRQVVCRAHDRWKTASSSSSSSRDCESITRSSDGVAKAAAATAAALALSLLSCAPALAGGYGTGLGYFQDLERERAISEEAVTLSSRDSRRANKPFSGGFFGDQSKNDRQANRRGIPLSLGSSDELLDDSAVTYSDPGFEPGRESAKWWQNAPREKWARAVFQWSFIIFVVANVRKSRNQGSAVTKRLGLTGKAGKALIGTRWKLTLDIGRERGTWMPPEWGASGRRILCPVAVELREGGVLECVGVGAFLPMTLSPGTWRLEGDALKFSVGMSGMRRGDIELPNDLLHFRTAAWGRTVASRGNLLLLQTRFGFRKEWRMVGAFKAEPLQEGDDLSGDEQDLYEQNKKRVVSDLGAMRVKERKDQL